MRFCLPYFPFFMAVLLHVPSIVFQNNGVERAIRADVIPDRYGYVFQRKDSLQLVCHKIVYSYLSEE